MTDQPDYQLLLEHARAVPWQATLGSDCFKYVGSQVAGLLGYPARDWLQAGFWQRHLYVADRAKVQSWLAGLTCSGAEEGIEYRVMAADGTLHWLHNSCVSVQENASEILVTGLMQDITAHRQQTVALAHLNRALRVVNACNTAMIQTDNEQALLEEICRVSVEAGGYGMAWVGIAVHDDLRHVRPVASYGHAEGYLDSLDVRWSNTAQGRGPTGTAIRTGQVTVARDIETDTNFGPWRASALQHGYASSIALPLRDRGQVFGAMCIYAAEVDAFDSESVELLSRLADNLAYGLTALRDRLQRQSSERYLEALYASSPDMIFLYGADGRLLDVNHNVLRCFGLAKAELLAANPRGLMGQDNSLLLAMRRLRRARQGEDQDFEWVIRRPDGEELPVEIRLRRLAMYRDQDEPRVIALVRDISERKRAEAAIEQRTAEFEAVFHSLADAAVFADPDRRMRLVNAAALTQFGYQQDELLGQLTQMLYASEADYQQQGNARFSRTATQAATAIYEVPYRRKDGSVFVGETMGSQVRSPSGEVLGYIGVIRDITARKQAEAQMATLSMALEQTADAVSIADPRGCIEYVNPAFEEITGYSRSEALGRSEAILKSGRHDDAFYRNMWQALNAGKPFRDIFINRRKGGELFYEEKTITPLRDEHGDIRHFVATGKDISERMETQERLRYLAHHDVLTELPNRTLFMDRLDHALAKRSDADAGVALLFLDLDRFKLINDSLGHDVGDRLLQVVAKRLRLCVRQGDTIARLGGDEFGIVLESLKDGRRAAEVAQQIIEALSKPIDEQTAELFVTSSIGISLAPLDAMDAQTLLKHADVAMYRAKESGRNMFQFYSAEMSAEATERFHLETQLCYALERQEFTLHYQPQVRLSDGQVVGVEALLRWRHPERGLVEPADFVPILEETGLIVPVGEWVLRTACQAIVNQPVVGEPLRLAVNFSSRQFAGSDVKQLLADVLAETGISATQLEVEITESLLLRDDAYTLKTLAAISAAGISIAVDDFGTGYSALSYLKRFPIDTLKIDHSFIRDISSDPDDAAIVKAIIAMARSLSLAVVAEGVATQAQLQFLNQQGCVMAQGYLFSPPGELHQVLGTKALS